MVSHARLRRLFAVGIPTVPAKPGAGGTTRPLAFRLLLADMVRVYRQSRSREIWFGVALGTVLAWSAFSAALWL